MTPPKRYGHHRLALAALAIYLACALATAASLSRGTGLPPVFIAAPAGESTAPAVSGQRAKLAAGSPGDLRPGDRLVRLGDISLIGVSPVGLFAAFTEHTRGRQQIAVDYLRDGVRRSTTLTASSMIFFLPLLLASSIFAIVAYLLWTRAPRDGAARGFALCFANLAIYLSANFYGSAPATYAAMAIHVVSATLIGPLSIRATQRFPQSATAPPSGRWPWLFAAIGPLHTGHFGGPVPPSVGVPAAALLVAVLLVICLTITTRAYHRADAIGRRRIRWALFGMYCATMPPIACAVISAYEPALVPIYYLSLTSMVFIPISLLIAIRRFNLFDIDRLISTATTYNVLTLVVTGVAAATVPRAAELVAAMLGTSQWLALTGLSLPFAGFVVHASRRLRPHIDRMFFSDRHDFDAGISELAEAIRNTEHSTGLVELIGSTLERLLRPDSCAVYGPADASGAFGPWFATTQTAPPTLAGDSPTVATLRNRRAPLTLGRDGWRGADPFERAVLETLAARIVVPIHSNGDLVLILCLGEKGSGDVYTPVDVGLLRMIAEVASAQLERFAQQEEIESGRRVESALRNYLPSPIANTLRRGLEVKPSEREVTVMFVDLRGYTSLCESLRPDEIYAAVGAYTEAIAAVIESNGGCIVEFSGDGLMAIFGAPEPLPAKERSALRSAHEVAATLADRGPIAPDAGNPAIGIGIASGAALCGNIHAGDRTIWTAVGNCVNLAARLQALTRDLDALIAIDSATHDAVPAGADFCCHRDVYIRGRSEPQDVYTVPLRRRVAAA